MMAKFVSNDWEIYFHPQLFGFQYQELLNGLKNYGRSYQKLILKPMQL